MGGVKGFGLLHVGTGPGHLHKLKDRSARKTPLVFPLHTLAGGEHFWNRAWSVPCPSLWLSAHLVPPKHPAEKDGGGDSFSPLRFWGRTKARWEAVFQRVRGGTLHTAPLPHPACPPVTEGPSPRRCGRLGAGDALRSWHVSQGHTASLLQGSSALLAALDSELLLSVISRSRWRRPGLFLPAEPSNTIFTGSDE